MTDGESDRHHAVIPADQMTWTAPEWFQCLPIMGIIIAVHLFHMTGKEGERIVHLQIVVLVDLFVSSQPPYIYIYIYIIARTIITV